MTNEYDLVVLGGGTGGYVAAIRASQLGMKTAVVENKKVGGTCLHRGCIPSKSLLKSAEKWRDLQNMEQFGLKADQIDFDFTKIQARKEQTVETLHKGVQSLLKKADIDIYHGFGRILGPSIFSPVPGTISVEYGNGEENTMIVPKYVMIATGSHSKELPIFPFNEKVVLNSDEALEMDQLPSSMIIIGGGIIGIEWASMLVDYGVKVTVIEQSETILPEEDELVQKEMQRRLEKRGVLFKTGISLDENQVHITDQEVRINIIDNETIRAEKVLVSIGRTGNTNTIGLKNTDIVVENGFIQTNEMFQTNESHIYAIGDCIGGMQLAHSASQEGIVAVEHMANKNPAPLDEQKIPSCIYSYPEAAKIGLTEKSAKEAGYSLKIGTIPFQAIGKTHVNGDPEGTIKMITDAETEDILGVHLIGEHATELISEASLAMTLHANAWEIAQTIHPHPTVSEIFKEAAMAVEKEQIHG